ncbi:MAG: CCA tRNA nucleotidyltransferase [Pseudomonadota bacterium]
MSETMPIQPWMARPSTQRVMKVLDEARPGCARFVGGCVRNALLGVSVSDIDIATQLPPDDVTAVLKRSGIAVHPTGIDHGTVTAVANGDPFEITTLRRDVETDGRRAVVAYTDDWVEDAERRDFRLNALYADLDGTLHDPTGSGIQDLNDRRIVFIGDPETRIREDYLRILRFFRFNAWYGRKSLNAEGLAACAKLKDGLVGVSVERIWVELKKLLSAEDPRDALKAMAQSGVLGEIVPEAHGLDLLDQWVAIEMEQDFQLDPIVRFLALFSKDPDLMDQVARRLKLSNSERARLVAAAADQTQLKSFMSAREVRGALYAMGAHAYRDRVRLAWANDGRDETSDQWRALLAMADDWERPELPLSGEDVLAAGVPAGPKVGEVIRAVEDWWIDADFVDDKDAILERLNAVAQALD